MRDIITFPLHLPDSLQQALQEITKEDENSLNQFIIAAIEEKLSAMKTHAFFEKIQREANLERFWQMLNRQGGQPPCEGDEL